MKPIIFSTEMVRAILEGRKTQTRRVLKHDSPLEDKVTKHSFEETCVKGTWIGCNDIGTTIFAKCPYGKVGDSLRLIATWSVDKHYDKIKPSMLPHGVRLWSLWDGIEKPSWCGKLRSPRFTPKFLYCKFPKADITNIRVERVRDITRKDCRREGLHFPPHGGHSSYLGITMRGRSMFEDLWNSINEKRGYGWDKNPWVWVVEFRRI